MAGRKIDIVEIANAVRNKEIKVWTEKESIYLEDTSTGERVILSDWADVQEMSDACKYCKYDFLDGEDEPCASCDSGSKRKEIKED